MKPAPFDYERATSVAHALQRAHDVAGSKYLAGGQSLLAVMNYRLARPEHLVDIGHLAELRRAFEEPESMLFGGLCTHRFLETDETVGRRLPLLREAARHIGHVAIRNSGTLGGSLAHADPAAELPAALMALGASVFIERHGHAVRELPLAGFYQGFYATVLEAPDLITWVRVPALGDGFGWGFEEVARRHGDFAEAGCVAVVGRADEGVTSVRVVHFGLADRPVLVDLPEVSGTDPDWDQVAMRVAATLDPVDRPDYRRRLAAHCVAAAIKAADARAQHPKDKAEPADA